MIPTGRSGHERRRRQAAELAGQPEAHTARTSKGRIRRSERKECSEPDRADRTPPPGLVNRSAPSLLFAAAHLEASALRRAHQGELLPASFPQGKVSFPQVNLIPAMRRPAVFKLHDKVLYNHKTR
jgi:hypothetical protein